MKMDEMGLYFDLYWTNVKRIVIKSPLLFSFKKKNHSVFLSNCLCFVYFAYIRLGKT